MHRTAARSNNACHLTDEACQPRAVATALVGRDSRFAQLATCLALPLVQHPIRNLGTNDRQLNNLMGVIWSQLYKPSMATRTSRRKKRYGCGGF